MIGIIVSFFRFLAADPLRAVLILAVGLLGVSALKQTFQVSALRSEAAVQVATVAMLESDLALATAANQSIAAQVAEANAAALDVAAACEARVRDEAQAAAVRATQALNAPRKNFEGEGPDAMNAWLESYP